MNNILILIAGKYLIFLFTLPFIYFFLTGRRELVVKAAFSAGLAIGLALFINFVFPVARPFEVWQTEPTVPIFIFEYDSNLRTASFPSKHVSAGSAIAFSFWPQNALLGVALFVGTLFMGTARVFSLIHRWIDVIGGVILGLFSYYIIGFSFKYIEKLYINFKSQITNNK